MSWQSKGIHVCILTCVCTHIFLSATIYIYTKHEFILMTPSLIHYHMDHSSLPPFLISRFQLQRNLAPTWTTHFLNWLIPVYMHSDVRTADLDLQGKQFYQLEYSAYIQFLAFSFTDPTHLWSYLGQQLSQTPILFSEVVSCIGNAIRLFCHILHSVPESLDLLNVFVFVFVFFAYMKIHALCCKIVCTITMPGVIYPPLQYHAE